MYKPRITRVLLIENTHYIFATVYYVGNVRRTYRCKRDGEFRSLPKTVRNFMHSPEVAVTYKDHSNCFVPWREWIYRKIG